jgi:hypothetical protein
MDRAVQQCLVTGYAKTIETLTLPDPDDRHVLAAAIVGGASVIVTFNEKDFPPEYLASFDVQIWHPDIFFCHLISLDSSAVCHALKKQRASLKNPPRSAEEVLATLAQQGLPVAVSKLRGFIEYL